MAVRADERMTGVSIVVGCNSVLGKTIQKFFISKDTQVTNIRFLHLFHGTSAKVLLNVVKKVHNIRFFAEIRRQMYQKSCFYVILQTRVNALVNALANALYLPLIHTFLHNLFCKHFMLYSRLQSLLLRGLFVFVPVVMLLCVPHGAMAQENIYSQTRKLNDVLNLVNQNYVDSVQLGQLTESAIRGLLQKLDPHSNYLPPKDRSLEQEKFQGNYFGIGVMFRIIKDTITILTPLIGGPSEKLGILCNDKIVKIDGASAIGLKTDDVPLKLKGPQGTRVSIHVKREGSPNLIPLTIMRDAVPIRTVDASWMIDGTDIGYIYLNKFAATTVDEIQKAAQNLKVQGMKKLILDLRNNGGGYLQQAFGLVDEFVPAGKTIVYTKARNEALSERYFSTRAGNLESMPLIVLVNSGSASASEIVSGAIQDLDRGLVVGETSFGKGLVQVPYQLSDGSELRLTIARYFTPSGRCIQRDYKLGGDRSKYYALEGRQDVEEGSNLDHKHDNDTTPRPKYKTLAGRTVYGGGGIVPDYIVKNDSVSKFVRNLSAKGVISEFVENLVLTQGNRIREKYAKDLPQFLHKYNLDDVTMAELKRVAGERKVEWTEEEYLKDAPMLDRYIKALASTYIWNTSPEFVESYVEQKELEKAVQLFPEAMKIARAR
jgi:carboxyl-terminal processing protease